ncbi:MAG: hypothetical protein AAF721_03505 [Myxococcota bacterium]
MKNAVRHPSEPHGETGDETTVGGPATNDEAHAAANEPRGVGGGDDGGGTVGVGPPEEVIVTGPVEDGSSCDPTNASTPKGTATCGAPLPPWIVDGPTHD